VNQEPITVPRNLLFRLIEVTSADRSEFQAQPSLISQTRTVTTMRKHKFCTTKGLKAAQNTSSYLGFIGLHGQAGWHCVFSQSKPETGKQGKFGKI
jgi:hypothetical protein